MLFPAAMLALLPAIFATPTPYKPAPLHKPRSATSIIPGKYIVKFRDDTADVSLNAVLASHKPDRIYSSPGFRGFAGSLDSASLDSIRSLSEVRPLPCLPLTTTSQPIPTDPSTYLRSNSSSKTPSSLPTGLSPVPTPHGTWPVSPAAPQAAPPTATTTLPAQGPACMWLTPGLTHRSRSLRGGWSGALTRLITPRRTGTGMARRWRGLLGR